MKIKIATSITALVFSVNTSWAGLGSLAKLITDGAVSKVIVKEGIVGQEAQSIESTAQLALGALQSLSKNGKISNGDDLRSVISSLPDSGEMGALKKNLSAILVKDGDDVTVEDLKVLRANLAYVAHHFGDGSAQLKKGCGQGGACDAFATELVKVHNKRAASFIKRNPVFKDKAKTFSHVRAQVKKHGLGDLRDAPEADVRSVAFFINQLERGTKNDKNLAKAVVKLSKNETGEADIFATNFYRYYVDNASSARSTKRMADLLNDAAEKCAPGTKAIDCFYQALDRRAADSPHLKADAEKIKAQGCFKNAKKL
jgi:hypothetical protein